MPVGRNSRYTPPRPRSMKTPARNSALNNIVMGLGAGNMGTSQTAINAQNAAFDQVERIRAFDEGVAPGISSRTGRAPGTRGRIVPGLGSGGYTGPDPSALRAPASNGYGSLMSKGQAGAVARATESGAMARSARSGSMATQTRGLGPAALGQRAPLALPAAGQSMASPAGTGYGSLVTRGDVQRNMEGLRGTRAGRPAASRPVSNRVRYRGSRRLPVSRAPVNPGPVGRWLWFSSL